MARSNLKSRSDAIRRRRLAKGWSQILLAEASGLSVSSISGLERGNVFAHAGTFSSIARALECTVLDVAELVELEGASA